MDHARGGWRLMREVAFASRRWLVIGIGSSLGWSLAKIAIPLCALQAVDEGIDPYDGGGARDVVARRSSR